MGIPAKPGQVTGEGGKFVGVERPVVEEVAERSEQPPGAEPASGGSSAPSMRSTIGARPRHPGDGLARLELAGPRSPHAESAEGVAHVTHDTDRLGSPVRLGQPGLDELANGKIDLVVQHFGARHSGDMAPVVG